MVVVVVVFYPPAAVCQQGQQKVKGDERRRSAKMRVNKEFGLLAVMSFRQHGGRSSSVSSQPLLCDTQPWPPGGEREGGPVLTLGLSTASQSGVRRFSALHTMDPE